MALSREAYEALEDTVGSENISEDPADLDAYAFQMSAEISRGGSKFTIRPEAVLLPGSTEEVQAIVRTCNRYKLKVKPYSTGWGMYSAIKKEGMIQLDLRRMDRILEIDEQNMFAVVEPYVIGSTLQAEAMKLGLNTHMIGAGGVASPLAAATSLVGVGPDSIFMGHGAENLLALEWVMPTGDILRTGSLGAGNGWFCGEGPGPSIRCISRGEIGAMGGMGVFTKCAIKLYPWPGPSAMPLETAIPSYRSPLPENFKAYTLAFPSWQAYADACYKIYDAEIGYIIHRQFNKLGGDLSPTFFKMIYTDPMKTMGDLEELLKTPEMQKLTEEMRISFQIVLAGMTLRDIDYQEKALSEILVETGGWKVAAMAEPDMEKFTLLYLIKLCFKNLNYVYSGGYWEGFSQRGTPDFQISFLVPAAKELLRKHQETGLLVECGADSMMGAIGGQGGGGGFGLEQFCFYDPHDKESVKAAAEYLTDAARIAKEKKLGGRGVEDASRLISPEERQLFFTAEAQPALGDWQSKIKEAFDPNDIGDRSYLKLDKPST